MKQDLVSKNRIFYVPSCPSQAGFNFTSAKKREMKGDLSFASYLCPLLSS